MMFSILISIVYLFVVYIFATLLWSLLSVLFKDNSYLFKEKV